MKYSELISVHGWAFHIYYMYFSERAFCSIENTLVFLEKMKTHNKRLLRWSLYLQKFPLKIVHLKGSRNIIADALSRAFTKSLSSPTPSSHSVGLDLQGGGVTYFTYSAYVLTFSLYIAYFVKIYISYNVNVIA